MEMVRLDRSQRLDLTAYPPQTERLAALSPQTPLVAMAGRDAFTPSMSRTRVYLLVVLALALAGGATQEGRQIGKAVYQSSASLPSTVTSLFVSSAPKGPVEIADPASLQGAIHYVESYFPGPPEPRESDGLRIPDDDFLDNAWCAAKRVLSDKLGAPAGVKILPCFRSDLNLQGYLYYFSRGEIAIYDTTRSEIYTLKYEVNEAGRVSAARVTHVVSFMDKYRQGDPTQAQAENAVRLLKRVLGPPDLIDTYDGPPLKTEKK